MSFLHDTQVLCSSLIFREDMDVGFVVLGDLPKKSRCINMRIEEIVGSLKALRSTQLHLMHAAMGLEDPSDDIAADVHCARALLHEVPAMLPTSNDFVSDVHQELGLDNLENVHFPSQPPLEGVDHISTQDLSITQLTSELRASPLRFVTNPMPLSSDELMCSMHSHNPPSPTLYQVLGSGPWFLRTPSHTLAIGAPGCRTTISP